jgi:hypothetical protein
MIYYPIGRATSVVGRLPGMAATSGRENRPVLWLRTLSLFHFMDTIKIMIMIVTFMNPCLMGQTIGIKNLDAVTMDPAQAQALTTRVQETATRYVETVTRNQGLLDVLNEHSLAMAGATTGPDDSLGLTRATQIISGSATRPRLQIRVHHMLQRPHDHDQNRHQSPPARNPHRGRPRSKSTTRQHPHHNRNTKVHPGNPRL